MSFIFDHHNEAEQRSGRTFGGLRCIISTSSLIYPEVGLIGTVIRRHSDDVLGEHRMGSTPASGDSGEIVHSEAEPGVVPIDGAFLVTDVCGDGLLKDDGVEFGVEDPG